MQALQLIRYRRTGILSNWSGKGDRQPLQLVSTRGYAGAPADQVQERRLPLQQINPLQMGVISDRQSFQMRVQEGSNSSWPDTRGQAGSR